MLSIREIKERTETFLAGKGIEDSRLETDLLIAHSLGLRRLDLYLDLDRPLTEAQLDVLRPLVKRRSQREPIQYILGETDFYGRKLRCDPRALIPRPETEELIERIETTLTSPPRRILDLGTGTGAIAIALASIYPEATLVASDSIEAALALAKENVEAHSLQNRIELRCGSWWDVLKDGETFDLIVSNPPYLTKEEMNTAAPEVVDHEPHSALASGVDGMSDLDTLLSGANDFLTNGGQLALETGISQSERLLAQATTHRLHAEIFEDLSDRTRFCFARKATG